MLNLMLLISSVITGAECFDDHYITERLHVWLSPFKTGVTQKCTVWNKSVTAVSLGWKKQSVRKPVAWWWWLWLWCIMMMRCSGSLLFLTRNRRLLHTVRVPCRASSDGPACRAWPGLCTRSTSSGLRVATLHSCSLTRVRNGGK